MNVNTRALLLIIPTLLVLSACATRLDYASPLDVDLSGTWLLDSSASQEVIFSSGASNKAGRGEKGKRKSDGKRGGRRPDGNGDRADSERASRGSKKADSTVATEMKIDHVSDSMGIMYQSGSYRDIDWGVVEKRGSTIIAGWQDGELIVKTKGQRGTITETYTLSANGNTLSVLFEVSGGEYVRVYQRQIDQN